MIIKKLLNALIRSLKLRTFFALVIIFLMLGILIGVWHLISIGTLWFQHPVVFVVFLPIVTSGLAILTIFLRIWGVQVLEYVSRTDLFQEPIQNSSTQGNKVMADNNSKSSKLDTNSGSTSPSPIPNDAEVKRPITQGSPSNKKNFRDYLPKWLRPEWMQELPKLSFKPTEPNKDFQLIPPEIWTNILNDAKDEVVVQQMSEDKKFLDEHLLRLFIDRDYQAKMHQNHYRLIQISFMILAALATTIGAGQALSLSNNPSFLPDLAFLEIFVALFTTFLAAISGREPPLPLWLNNRRRAEQLRREYFRFLMNLPPYDALTGYKREMELSQRAANINRGVFPDEPSVN